MMSAAAIPTVNLNDGNAIPVLGLGVGELSDSETEQSVSAALEAGYRLIDTAAAYGNEAAVGRAIAASGVPREELPIGEADQRSASVEVTQVLYRHSRCARAHGSNAPARLVFHFSVV